ncbi:MAG: DUF4416 family protein [Planctomycetota bacterium]|nr:DUF4416 family protein [Planctomycetota bacterium]
MGAIVPVRRVTPFCAILHGHDEDLPPAREALLECFGPLELESEPYPFTATEYYRDEMGAGLRRTFLTFQRLADPAELPEWKRETNELEARLAEALAARDRAAGRPERRRPVNLDPGYLSAAKLVLASTKDFAHRIYLRQGIFAEITLAYRAGRWEPHPFTFPDFRAETYHAFLTRARDRHMRKDGLEAPRSPDANQA